MSYKNLLIDFDGTIIDSETILYESWRRVYEIFGYKLNMEFWITTIRPQKPHAAAYYSLRDNIPDPPSPEAVQSLQKRFEEEMMKTVPLRQGIMELMQFCKFTANVSVAIVSSSKLSWILPHMERLKIAHLIDFIITPENVSGRKKPDPACFAYALHKMNCAPINAIAIEDSPWGILSAKNAGLSVIAFPNNITRCMNLSIADMQIDNGMEAEVCFK